MDETSKYIPPDWNLKNWARIAYSASLWNKPTIGLLIKANSETELAAQIKEMLEKKEKEMHLPKAILDQVLWTFKSMGERIHEWCKYARQILKIPKDIAERVHWTTYGTIDERKMLQNLISSKEFKEGRHLVPIEAKYYLACSSVSIEYIKLHWEEMLTFWKARENESTLLDQKADKLLELIIASVIFFANRNDSRIPVSYVEKYSDVENLFTLSIKKEYPTAARYYWFQLNENQKKDLILPTAKTLNLELTYCNNYKNQCISDLLIFFLSSMSDDDLRMQAEDKEFRCRDTEDILNLLMSHWPFDEYLPLAYDLISKYCKNEKNCQTLLSRILSNMDEKNKTFGLWNKQNFARKLFKFVWYKLEPYYTVKEYFESKKELLEKIFTVFDFQILNFIINIGYDEGKPRYILIHRFQDRFVKIIKANRCELLEKFACYALQSENDRILFRDVFCKHLLSIYG